MSHHLDQPDEDPIRDSFGVEPSAGLTSSDRKPSKGSSAPAASKLSTVDAVQSELSVAYAALLADREAYRSRLDREEALLVAAEKASVAQALLDSIDDLERALSVVTQVSVTQAQAIRDLTLGVKLSLATLYERIQRMGAERMNTVGQRFNPQFAEAIGTLNVTDPAQDGIILQEIRAGYHSGDRLLRPARVRVGRLHAERRTPNPARY